MSTLVTDDAVPVSGKCQYEGCDKPATHIAKGRSLFTEPEKGHLGVAAYCEKHADEVADEFRPEYIETCPNCGCMFGVN